MEDGIERSIVNYEKEKEEKEKEEKEKEEKESKREKYVYIFLQSNGNYIIFFDKDKAIEYSQKNNCCVDIFIETENGVYIRTGKLL
jgi:hypothetical protein